MMKRQNFTAPRFVENRLSLLLSVYAVSFLLCFLLAALMPEEGENLSLLLLVLPLVAQYLPLLFFLRSEEGRNAPLGLDRIKRIFLPEFFLLCAAAFLLGTGGAVLYDAISVPLFVCGTVSFPGKFSFLSFVALVLLSAFCEEMLVRGALQTHFRSFGGLTAILCSACLSAAFGFSVVSLPFLILTGLLCAVARERTASLLSPLACAALWRLGAYLVSLSVWQNACVAIGAFLFALLLIGVAILCAACALLLGKHKKKQRGHVTVEVGRRRLAVFLTAIVALALSVGASFLISII